MNIDPRLFKYAGSSSFNGAYKARFANDPDARPKVMVKAGHTDFVLVELPEPMTKLDAIAWLKANAPAGVNIDALDAKEKYILAQSEKLAKVTAVKTPATAKTAKTVKAAVPASKAVIKPKKTASAKLVNSIVNSAKKNRVRVKTPSVPDTISAEKSHS